MGAVHREPAEVPARPDRRAAKRQAARDEIVSAAWDLVREHGLAGLAMRDLGERVGMRAQSIYSYFASKHEIYDAMFHEGYLAFVAVMDELDEPGASADDGAEAIRARVHRVAHGFFDFCTSDPVRYQLLFQRTIPEFVPSPASYAVALEAYDSMRAQLARVGVTDPDAADLVTATLTGLTDQQISNDPGGDRWRRLVGRAMDMVLREIAPHLGHPTDERTPS